VIPVPDSVKMVRLLRSGGCNVKFTVYPDADHDSWTDTYTNTALYDWLLEHTNNGE
jgi:dipeptidyl aminopeptidase/acylaminoacyl peptidase